MYTRDRKAAEEMLEAVRGLFTEQMWKKYGSDYVIEEVDASAL